MKCADCDNEAINNTVMMCEECLKKIGLHKVGEIWKKIINILEELLPL